MKFLQNYFLLLLACFVITGCTLDDETKELSGKSHKLALGASANDFLSDENYTSLSVEIVYVTNFAPTASAVSNLKSFLETYLHKPDGVKISLRAIAPPGLGTYSLEELREVEDEHRTIFTSGTQLAAYIFFADDKSETAEANRPIIGKAYRNTSMVIFQKEVQELASKSVKTSLSEMEHTTMRHEFGHLFGLVNNGSPAQSAHEDTNPEHKAHCNITGCLMTASLDFNAKPLDAFENNSFLDFDEKCRQDLKANGGK